MQGSVETLFMKPQRGEPMVKPPGSRLSLQAGWGIVGDANADPFSPRHVLLLAAETLEEFHIPQTQLRGNIILRHFHVDGLSSGSVLQIGTTVRLRTTFACETCNKVGKTNQKRLNGRRGILSVVLTGGEIQIGDIVNLLDEKHPEIPEKVYPRFLWLVKQIPFGKVINYKQLARLAGFSQSYLRAMPSFLKRARNTGCPIHRIVDSKGNVVPHIPDQAGLLQSEGVLIVNSRITDIRFFWNPEGIFTT